MLVFKTEARALSSTGSWAPVSGLLLLFFLLLAGPAANCGETTKPGSQSGIGKKQDLRSKRVIVIAHRGACAYRPEHTLAAYELAINMGADFVEPDLVSTKDGVLIARHENEISETTDVQDHPEFRQRKCKKKIDGVEKEGWFTEDFSLKELKNLRAKERLPQIRKNNTIYDGMYEIPTLQDVIDLVKRKNAELGKSLGLYIELKHPSYFAGLKLDLESKLLATLAKNGFDKKVDSVFLQCFEPSTLKSLRRKCKYRLIQLIDEEGSPFDAVAKGDKESKESFAQMLEPEGLREIARYAHGIGPNKRAIVPCFKDAAMQKPSPLVENAHAAGLLVHPWTFRNENQFLAKEFRRGNESDPCFDARFGNAIQEYKLFYDLGVDGVFSESPDTALEACSR